MSLIEFSSVPVVAVDFMNEVHEEEVAMINDLHLLVCEFESGATDVEHVSKAANELFVHTQEHFQREERFMQDGSFPPYPMHKAEHDAFLSDFEAVLGAWKEGAEIGALKGFLEGVLPAWLHQHISTMDFVTARFLSR